jgi:hypothetical protein
MSDQSSHPSASAQRKPTLFVINGTSGSGKTVVAQQLQRAVPGAFMINYYDVIAYEFNTIAQNAGFQGTPGGSYGDELHAWICARWSQEQRDKMCLQIEPRYYQIIVDALRQGHDVITEKYCTYNDIIRHYEATPPQAQCITTLLYCPLAVLPYHLLIYNKDHSHDTKDLLCALEQFIQLFHGQKINTDDAISIMTERDIQVVFTARDMRVFPGLTIEKVNSSLNVLELSIRHHFKMNEHQDSYVSPIIPHDIVINSGMHDIDTCVSTIIAKLKTLSF